MKPRAGAADPKPGVVLLGWAAVLKAGAGVDVAPNAGGLAAAAVPNAGAVEPNAGGAAAVPKAGVVVVVPNIVDSDVFAMVPNAGVEALFVKLPKPKAVWYEHTFNDVTFLNILCLEYNENKATRSPEIFRQQVQKLTPPHCPYLLFGETTSHRRTDGVAISPVPVPTARQEIIIGWRLERSVPLPIQLGLCDN